MEQNAQANEPVGLGKVNWSAGFKDAEGPTGFRIPAPSSTSRTTMSIRPRLR